ncbi:MAG: PAM68 family protein [Elainellaceae cyanobacterium]
MSSKSQNDTQDSNRLPFEPSSNRKKVEKEGDKNPSSPPTSASQDNFKRSSSPKQARGAASNRIPEVVSRRMVKRMAIFCGIPTFLGVSSFFVSYFVVTQGIELPTTAVLLVSLGLFGLGVVGLTYGALSTSWDESMPGGLLGLDEFTLNLGRMKEAWKEAREQAK